METSAWFPTEDPVPSGILHSAVADKRAGRYEQALAKFLWFHDNAVHYQRGISSVRVSFALGYWMDLASVYQPARDAFLQTRNSTEDAFRNQPAYESFRDLAAMNKALGDELRTADLFEAIAESDPVVAQDIYHVAEQYLIAAGRFRACAPFLEVDKRMEVTASAYRLSQQHEESRPQTMIPIPHLARKNFMHEVATLLALLVLNDRSDDARSAYNQALATIDDDEFRIIMDAAMSGHLP